MILLKVTLIKCINIQDLKKKLKYERKLFLVAGQNLIGGWRCFGLTVSKVLATALLLRNVLRTIGSKCCSTQSLESENETLVSCRLECWPNKCVVSSFMESGRKIQPLLSIKMSGEVSQSALAE